ncbi:uncharacterized protein LOC111341091 [Stylophora pistillata]|uniref:uncharacterized protein LOC111341091 n=1 Tax=Stylophora pistillata TaxID=50429 RepID=UPI000C03B9D7|nr:uncharacterized protein LOC111341091 [Stylophora pistillata]
MATYHKAGPVTVTVKSTSGILLGNIPFEYIDHENNFLKQMVCDPKSRRKLFLIMAEREQQPSLHPPHTDPTTGSSQASHVLATLVYAAAKFDAPELIRMIFDSSSGGVVFHAYKDRAKLPESVARDHGNDDTATYLEEVTTRFYEEIKSGKEFNQTVDWLELIKAADEAQAIKTRLAKNSTVIAAHVERNVIPPAKEESRVFPSAASEGGISPSAEKESGVTPSDTKEKDITPLAATKRNLTPSGEREINFTLSAMNGNNMTTSNACDSGVKLSNSKESNVTPSADEESDVTLLSAEGSAGRSSPEGECGGTLPPESESDVTLPPESESDVTLPPESESDVTLPPESESDVTLPPESESDVLPSAEREGDATPANLKGNTVLSLAGSKSGAIHANLKEITVLQSAKSERYATPIKFNEMNVPPSAETDSKGKLANSKKTTVPTLSVSKSDATSAKSKESNVPLSAKQESDVTLLPKREIVVTPSAANGSDIMLVAAQENVTQSVSGESNITPSAENVRGVTLAVAKEREGPVTPSTAEGSGVFSLSHIRSVAALSASQDVDLVSSAAKVRDLMPSATEGSVESDTLNEQIVDPEEEVKEEQRMSVVPCAPSFHWTKETTNYARLCRLLVDVGSGVLRQTFERKRPPGNLDTVLSSPPVHTVLLSLKKKKVLNPLQWGKLYPTVRCSVSSKNFDITLLMVLLRNICGIVAPPTGWNTLPTAADMSLEADIVRIKCYRNIVYGHASEALVDDTTFNRYWQDIQGPVVRLGGAEYQSAIGDQKKECMDPDFEEHYKELLRQWVKDEVSIKERLDEMTEKIGKSLDELKEAIVNPTKKAGDKAVTQYSNVLKESIRGQTEYLAQVSPTLPKVRTDHIFTNILMQHGRKPVQYLDLERKECLDPHGQTRRKFVEDLDLKREKHLRQCGQMSSNRIKHSQEIFHPTDGKDSKSVLVTGKAGIGKTLFCQKLIRDWADNKLFESLGNTNLADFKFAYLLTFRQLNLLGDNPVTLKDILNRSSVLDDHSNIDDSLFEYIVDHPEEVLVIFDGYDEFLQRDSIASDLHEKYPNNAIEKMPSAAVCAKLLKGKILRGSVVVITSRPDESDKMKDEHIHFDRYVEITGFSEPQVKEYIGKYFKNNEGMKNTVLDHITKNVNLFSLAHIPALCFLMCSYFEYSLQHSDITNPLPVKTSDLYDEVVKMFVQKHDKNKRLPLEVTVNVLSKLAAQLLRERTYLFIEEDLKTFNSQEVKSLCESGLLHCGPLFRKCFSATTKYFCFTHLTLQEYLAARWLVKEKKTPPQHVSPEVYQFMSGILSKQKDAILMEKLLEKVLRPRFSSAGRNRLEMFKCLMEYEDVEFAKRIVKKHHRDIFREEGGISFFCSLLTDVDCTALCFLLHVFGALDAEGKSKVKQGASKRGAKWKLTTLDQSYNQIPDAGSLCEALQTPTYKLTKLNLSGNQITDAGVASLCQALQTPTCKLTTLDLSFNQITDAGVVSLCQVLEKPTCKLTTLELSFNQITDAGVVSFCQVLQTPTCKLTALNLMGNQITDAVLSVSVKHYRH